jgi:S-(hydroxymethyl)glutathione dehydrogenase/alcohol dehydrogenase
MGDGRLTTGPSPISGGEGRIATYSLLGCFAEHAVVAARSVIPLPPDVPADVAALIGCAVITGVGAAIATVDVSAGSRGAVIGCGGVGVNAIQGARVRGAAEIVAIDPSLERRQRAGRFGATDAVDGSDDDGLGRLRARAPREGFDWAIVTVGSTEAMRLGIDVIRPGGVAVPVGLTPEGSLTPVDMLDVVTYEKRIVGSAYGTFSPLLLVPRIIDLYLRGRLLLDELVSDRFPLEGINEAFELSRRAGGLRPVLELSDGGRFP